MLGLQSSGHDLEVRHHPLPITRAESHGHTCLHGWGEGMEPRVLLVEIFFLINLFILFIYFWLHWVFVAVCGFSLVAASESYSLLQCVGFSLWWLLLLWSMGSRCAGSVVVAHGPSCSGACGILPDQGSNPCPLHWQADS